MGGTRRYRLTAGLGAAVLAASTITACGSGGGGITVNVYKYPQESFQTIVDNCNAKAGGRYTITATVMDDRERLNESELTIWVPGGMSSKSSVSWCRSAGGSGTSRSR